MFYARTFQKHQVDLFSVSNWEGEMERETEARCVFSLVSEKGCFEERDAVVCINDAFKDFSAELYNYFLFFTQTKYSFVFYLVFEVVSHVNLVGLKLTI